MHYNRLRLVGALAFFILAACAHEGPAATLELGVEAAAAIDAALVEAGAAGDGAAIIASDLRYLADDARDGREAGAEGYLEAAAYVAARFEQLGLEPGADRSWFQPVTMRAARRNLGRAQFTLQHQDGSNESLVHLEDYIIGQARASDAFDVVAPAVFVGYGVVDPDSGYDDYEGVDAAGKIVVAFTGAPADFGSERRAVLGSGKEKYRNAAARGAVGFISVPTISREKRRSWERAVAHPMSVSMTWIGPDGEAHVAAPSIKASAYVSAAGARKLFAGAPVSFDEARKAQDAAGEVSSFELPITVSLAGASRFTRSESPNVVAVIEGADPMLTDEALILSAHLDHIGVNEPEEGEADAINNGALDNAIGVATFLEVARKFQEGPPPRRTLVFLAVTGEEKGLLGADYFARFPTLKGKRMVGNINLDMPLMVYPFTDVIAFGAEQSSLGEAVRRAAEAMGVALSPDPIPEEGIFTRSDHYRFVEQGVPAVFLFTGFADGGEEVMRSFLREHYHQPSDDLSLPIDYDQAAKFAELNYRIARDIADADAAPHWNKGQYFADRYGK